MRAGRKSWLTQLIKNLPPKRSIPRATGPGVGLLARQGGTTLPHTAGSLGRRARAGRRPADHAGRAPRTDGRPQARSGAIPLRHDCPLSSRPGPMGKPRACVGRTAVDRLQPERPALHAALAAVLGARRAGGAARSSQHTRGLGGMGAQRGTRPVAASAGAARGETPDSGTFRSVRRL
jgi:hypothetical protein